MGIDPKFEQRVKAWADVIEQLDYYQLLRVDPKASQGQIRKAYHAQSRLFHPDRYYHLPDGETKTNIYLISKRVTEAYVTLRDPQKRGHYDKQLEDTQRAKLRYTEQSEKEQKKAKVEQIGTTEAGRKMYNQGMMEMKRKQYAAAERSFKMAMAHEPDNQLYKQKAEEAGHNIKTDYRIK